MHVFEIFTPGVWIESEDKDWAFKIQRQLSSLRTEFFEANAILNLFEDACANERTTLTTSIRERDEVRRQEIQRELEATKANYDRRRDFESIRIEATIRLKREEWAKGRIPQELDHKLKFIYARAFLYSLDAFDKYLGVLAQENNIPLKIIELHKKFAEKFPNLRGIRNTSQHMEDRARGLGAGRNPKPLDLKPINDEFINALNGGVLILSSLRGTQYGTTMADGHFGQIDVSTVTMKKLQEILHDALMAFEWTGGVQHHPSL